MHQNLSNIVLKCISHYSTRDFGQVLSAKKKLLCRSVTSCEVLTDIWGFPSISVLSQTNSITLTPFHFWKIVCLKMELRSVFHFNIITFPLPTSVTSDLFRFHSVLGYCVNKTRNRWNPPVYQRTKGCMLLLQTLKAWYFGQSCGVWGIILVCLRCN